MKKFRKIISVFVCVFMVMSSISMAYAQPNLQPGIVQALNETETDSSAEPSTAPSAAPSEDPNVSPSAEPGSSSSSAEPSAEPGASPSSEPSGQPGTEPGAELSAQPSTEAFVEPDSLTKTDLDVMSVQGDFTYNLINNGIEVEITGYTGSDAMVDIPANIESKPVKGIAQRAFENCTIMNSVVIPESVTTIGEYAFSNCTNLAAVNIPKNVAGISNGAFSGCTGLQTVVIENGVGGIGVYAFYGCSSLNSVTIPGSVSKVDGAAFAGCSSLTSISFPSGVQTIEALAFSQCSKLETVTISETVTSIGDKVFEFCPKLTQITVDSSNGNYSSSGGVLFDKFQTKLIHYPQGKTATSYTIPNTVTIVGSYAFAYCANLTTITIPDNATVIENSAFFHCTGLASVTLPSKLTSIESLAFAGCTGMTNVAIPSGVTQIGYSVFDNCSTLASAYFAGNAPGTFGSSVFNNTASGFKIYYSGGTTGWTTPTWNGYACYPLFAGGTGTASDPYLVSTPEQLNNVRNCPDASFLMTNDIDMTAATSTGGVYYNNGAGWEPIATLSGTFDGGGHTISGLTINRSDELNIGLFATTASGSSIHDIILKDIAVYGGDQCAGGLVGQSSSTIENVSAYGGFASGTNGLNTGGLIGENSGTVSLCSNACTVSGVIAGGIAGENYNGQIEKCYNTGDILGTYAGGIAGMTYSYSVISDCYNLGRIEYAGYPSKYYGGILGENYTGYSSILNCYNEGNVYTSSSTASGGIYGGNNYADAANCYYLNNIAKGSGYYPDNESMCSSKSMGALKQQATFQGFDFNNVWEIQENMSTPYLRGLSPKYVKVAFYPQGGNSLIPSQTVLYNSKATVPTEPYRGGYTFAGWYQDAACTVPWSFDTAITSATGCLMLYAKWTPGARYTVTYYGSGNTGGTAPTDTNTYAYEQKANVLGAGTLTKTGYIFIGWNDRETGAGTNYSAGGQITVYGNVKLYARWEQNINAISKTLNAPLYNSLHRYPYNLDPANTGWITSYELAHIGRSYYPNHILELRNAGITDITGLQYCTDIWGLELDGNSGLTDISSLASLSNLESLYLSKTGVMSLPSDMCGMTSLEDLDLSDNSGLTDISPVVGLSRLKSLDLGHTGVMILPSDMSGMTNLNFLKLRGLHFDSAANRNALLTLPQLKKDGASFCLNLTGTDIKDVSFLNASAAPGLTNLQWEYSGLKDRDIASLSGLTNLTHLYLNGNNGLSSEYLNAIKDLTKLNYLDLSYCGLTDISSLSSLTNLKSLDISTNPGIIDISALSNMSKLNSLDIGYDSVYDVSPLSGLSISNLDCYYSYLDPMPGSDDMNVIKSLPAGGSGGHFDGDRQRQITISYSCNSNRGTSSKAQDKVYYQQNYTLPTVTVKNGNIFLGWDADGDGQVDFGGGSTQAFTAAFLPIPGDSVMYTAVFSAPTVIFDTQGGRSESSTLSAVYGSTISQPTAPTKTGYTFGGWYKEPGCINPWNFASDIVTGNTTLYAKWTDITGPTLRAIYIPSPGTNAYFTVFADTVTDVSGVKSVSLAIWSEKNGQDDLKWYEGQFIGNNNYRIDVQAINHKNDAGKYFIDIYGTDNRGNTRYLGGTKVVLDFKDYKAPVLTAVQTSEKDSKNTTINVTATVTDDKSTVSTVEFAVWTQAKQMADLKWIKAANIGNGKWSLSVDTLSQFGGAAGVYYVDCYANDSAGNRGFIWGTTFNIQADTTGPTMNSLYVPSPGLSAGFTVFADTVKDDSGVKSVRYAVWSENGGQDDLKWYDGQFIGNNNYRIDVQAVNHKNDSGKYFVDIYGTDGRGNTRYLGGTTIVLDFKDYKAPVLTAVQTSEKDSKNTTINVTATVTDDRSTVSNVEFAVWTQAKQMADLKWIKAVSIGNGKWSLNVDTLSQFGGAAGIYYVDGYATDSAGNRGFIWGTTFSIQADTTGPTMNSLYIPNPGLNAGFTVFADTVKDDSGVKSVRYAVWSENGGQDDLKWYDGQFIGNNNYRIDVQAVNHKNDAGKYFIDIYGTDNRGNTRFLGGATVVLDFKDYRRLLWIR